MTNTSRSDYIIRLFDVASVTRKLLVIFILLLPLQRLLKKLFIQNKFLVKFVSYSDEVSTLLMFAILFTFIALKPKVYVFRIMELPTTRPLFLFILVASFSMAYNSVYVFQGVFGIYDVIKNILVFYVFATLRWRREEFLSFIFWIKVIIIVLAVTGIIGEILAIGGIDPRLNPLVRMYGEHKKRLGLDRVISITGTGGVNYLGLYALMGFFLIYATTKNKLEKFLGMFSTLGLIFLTFSRQAWMGLFAMLVLTKRKLIWPGLLIVAGIALMTIPSIQRYTPDQYYRSFTYFEAFRIFLDHPFFGAGPGMFGGLASVIFHSPYYDDWPRYFLGKIYSFGSLDAFWPSIFAEVGILGFMAYLYIWVALYRKLSLISGWYKSNGDPLMCNIGTVLKNYSVALVIMCFFTGFNKPFVVYTFFALCGIYLSLFLQREEDDGLIVTNKQG
ncbi:hypothetical protein MNBD_NITROSPIRAE02-1147 [hydrothermal vent metagenome]|uniref:Uncharacterized protein n=1 Tax=hydrothermal vent metagenome TaxID=652676 RepID=A0A3B1D9V1_9ZZZZ